MSIHPTAPPKKILLASAECSPLLEQYPDIAEFTFNLGRLIKHLGHDIRVILPLCRKVLEKINDAHLVTSLNLAGSAAAVHLHEWQLPTGIPCYLVELPSPHDRVKDNYRSPDGTPWPDNHLFFGLFCHAIVSVALNRASLAWQPDILHSNNWQTGLAPALLSEEWNRPATLFTLHRDDPLGVFPADTVHKLGISERYLHPAGLLSDNRLSYARGGLAFADWLSLPSQAYATQLEQAGFEQGLLFARESRTTPITPGIDPSEWNPLSDRYIEQRFELGNLAGKSANKAWLQRHFNLKSEERTLLLGYCGELDDPAIQNLYDLLAPRLVDLDGLQVVLSGVGSDERGKQLSQIAEAFPELFAVHRGHDAQLEHLLIAGCDALLIPESTLPSGQVAMRSLAYGTIPIARNAGTCKQFLTDTNSSTRLNGEATSFLYDDQPDNDQLNAIIRAMALYAKPRVWWEKLSASAMEQRFDLTQTAAEYLALYNDAIDNPAPNPLARIDG